MLLSSPDRFFIVAMLLGEQGLIISLLAKCSALSLFSLDVMRSLMSTTFDFWAIIITSVQCRFGFWAAIALSLSLLTSF